MNADQKTKRFDALREAGCLCCRMNLREGYRQTELPVEIHHLNAGGLAGGKRRGDEYTVPLCRWHHRASFNESAAPGGYDGLLWIDGQTKVYGPSWAAGSRAFRGMYGSDDGLLSLANDLIGEDA